MTEQDQLARLHAQTLAALAATGLGHEVDYPADDRVLVRGATGTVLVTFEPQRVEVVDADRRVRSFLVDTAGWPSRVAQHIVKVLRGVSVFNVPITAQATFRGRPGVFIAVEQQGATALALLRRIARDLTGPLPVTLTRKGRTGLAGGAYLVLSPDGFGVGWLFMPTADPWPANVSLDLAELLREAESLAPGATLRREVFVRADGDRA